MIAAFILVMAVMALVQFAVAEWKATWMIIAAQPISSSVESAVGIVSGAIAADDFDKLTRATDQLAPSPGERSSWVKEVRIYYRLVRALDRISAKNFTMLSEWANRELVACSRYAAVVLDERINANLTYASNLNS
jgi:hypothetical protein